MRNRLPASNQRSSRSAAMDKTASSARYRNGESVSAGLRQRGWWVQTHFFDADLIEQLALELEALHANGTLRAAGIGRGSGHQLATAVRGDQIHWLNRATPAQCRYLDCMETLRKEINRELFLGLFEYEAHFAYYQPGTFYKKHLDSFHGAANRVVSAVTYLNRQWPADGGGELMIYAPGHPQAAHSVVPAAGTLAVFLSAEIVHEVTITHKPRASIAGWFRINTSTHRQTSLPC